MKKRIATIIGVFYTISTAVGVYLAFLPTSKFTNFIPLFLLPIILFFAVCYVLYKEIIELEKSKKIITVNLDIANKEIEKTKDELICAKEKMEKIKVDEKNKYNNMLNERMSDIEKEKKLGIYNIKAGDKRDISYGYLREKAKKKIILIGAGMSILSEQFDESLEAQAKHVEIEIFMLNPYSFKELSIEEKIKYNEYFQKKDLESDIEKSYYIFRGICQRANSINTKKVKLYLYNTIPAFNMAMIDPDSENAEMIYEPNLYANKAKQPSLEIIGVDNNLIFNIIKDVYEKLKFISIDATDKKFDLQMYMQKKKEESN